MQSLYNLTNNELKIFLEDHGHKPFHAQQIFQWLYKKNIASFDEMTNLSKELRQLLDTHFHLILPTVLQTQHDPADQTHKILMEVHSGENIEAVVMPKFSEKIHTNPSTGKVTGKNAEQIDQYTICMSTQVGCMFACRFCASGQAGLTRNLNAGEIVSQLIYFIRNGFHVSRIVFMGMGEPLHNFLELKKAINIITSKHGLDFSPRRITISTVGLVPEIYRLAQEDLKCKLAISLHATTDHKRADLIPISKAYSLDQLKDALVYYQRNSSRRISFEYLMLQNFNDTPADADRLARLCEGLTAHVNLIPYNTVPRAPYKPSSPEQIKRFKSLLIKKRIDVTVRYSRGRNIDAACGQLRLRHELVNA